MPAVRRAIILVDEFINRHVTIRHALVREHSRKTLAVWDQITNILQDARATLIQEQGLNEEGVASKVDVAILAVQDKFAKQAEQNSTLNKKLETILSATTVDEVKHMAIAAKFSEKDVNKIVNAWISRNPGKVSQTTQTSNQITKTSVQLQSNNVQSSLVKQRPVVSPSNHSPAANNYETVDDDDEYPPGELGPHLSALLAPNE